MPNNFINSGTWSYSNLRNRTVFLLLFGVSFFLRLPFFFRDYIDRDESTFILLGQSWVEGNLPYTELWDLKPPLTFLFFAGVIYVFGKSFIAIRLFGTLLVALTAFFTYKIAKQTGTKKIAIWAALACIVLLTLFGSLQGVMSEHICMAFFVPGLYALLKDKKWYWGLLAGLLMGIALMTKMNIAYAILFLGVFMVFECFRTKEWLSKIPHVGLFGLGIVLVVSLTFLPYYLNESSEVWWKSVVLAPLEYIGARRYSLIKLAPIYLVLGGFFFITWKKKLLNFKSTNIQFLTVAILGVLFAFFKGGRINGHYLIQLHPMLVILVAIALANIHFLKKLSWKAYLVLPLLLIPMESYLEYVNIVQNKIKRNTFFNGEGISVPDYILQNAIETKNILFLGYHIGYWVLDTKPPTKAATHPSNICRDELFAFFDNKRTTSLEELRYIMQEIQPKTIIVRKNRMVFDKKEIEENEYINAYLKEHYRVHATVEKAEILQRLE